MTKGGDDYEGDNVRHVYGTALAVIVAGVMFFAGSWGYLRLLRLPVPPGRPAALPAGGGSLLANDQLLLALAAVIGAAVLAALLVLVPRVSPLAAGLPGVLLLAWTALYLVSVRRAVELIPLRSHAFGAGWEGLLFNGVLGAAGAVMVFPLFIPSRWRGRPGLPDAAPHAPHSEAPAPDAPLSEADDYLTVVTAGAAFADPGPRQREEDTALVGTVLPPTSPGVRRVDTTRITGASRALRATGTFRAATGMTPRASGSFGPPADTSRLGQPYPPADE